ncbi:hypothetical protein MUB24_11920 [Lederbergia sp. NSJ-179]|nr:hypothetical protein [Lederbergia sp. NSJ-179]MCJ7841590.1 hypothetical protein [Lederbergia sp. NSJ-179]
MRVRTAWQLLSRANRMLVRTALRQDGANLAVHPLNGRLALFLKGKKV